MQKLILFSLFSILFIALLANPAPQSIELLDLMLIALPFGLGVICLVITNHYHIQRIESNLFIAIAIYLSYLLLSMLLGLLHGVPILNVLRSVGPYINFFPLLLLGLLPNRLMNPWWIGIIFITVGFLQASYQIYLYGTHSIEVVNTLDILRGRITLLEPRTTLPIALSVTILPMAFFFSQNKLIKVIAILLMVLGLFAGITTLTRSIILSLLVGAVAFYLLFLFQQIYTKSNTGFRIIRQLSFYLLLFFIIVTVLSFVPKIQLLEQGLLARFSNHADYSNGRIYDEWIPALKTWANSDMLSWLFGIGAGNTFIVTTGEERTYIHNLCIYSLVYGGIYGLFACLWLYFTLIKTLLIRALHSQQKIYLAFAALVVSMFFYSQLFAVHKGLAFNVMLYLILTLALCQIRDGDFDGDLNNVRN